MFGHKGFDTFAKRWLPLLNEEMRQVLGQADQAQRLRLNGDFRSVERFYGMMHYQMGWVDETLQPGHFDVGKQIRPLLCLMACEAVGGDPEQALPAAAAIEILHNFSLVHDDIEDGDEMRRHRPTAWSIWGVPQAINAGDGMFNLAYRALLGLSPRGIPAERVVTALDRFSETCMRLTEGQYLDMSFEQRLDVSVEEYLQMIAGKTAALIAAALSIGALVGGADRQTRQALGSFGHNIGMAFQIRDDILGIWGDPGMTGKAAGNDILRQKKSLPILHGLSHPEYGPQMEKMWRYNTIGSKQLTLVLSLLNQSEAREFAETKLRNFHQTGMDALHEALGEQAAHSPLMALADGLMARQM
jgi:geranylgeranyl diphosphate synthase type I